MRAILGMTLALAAGAATAQQGEIANGAAFGDWRVSCDALSNARTACRVVQTQNVAQTGQLVANFLAYPLEGGEALFVAQVPMGVYLPAGAVYRPQEPADSDQRELIWQRCGGEICEAALQMDGAEVTGLSASGAILFGYQMDPGSPPVITRVDMTGFDEALAALAGDGG